MAQEIHVTYEQRMVAAEAEFGRQKRRGDLWGLLGAIFLILTGRELWMSIGRPGNLQAMVGFWCGVIVTGIFWKLARRRERKAARLVALYSKAIDRVSRAVTQSGHSGDVFTAEGHLYARDLDVVGKDSLFGLLATTRTALGQRALAGLLLNATNAVAVRQRQNAVRELTPELDLRERIALLGESRFEEIPAESFDAWMDVEAEGFPSWARPLLSAITVLWLALLVLGVVLHDSAFAYLHAVELLLLAQAALGAWLRPRVLVQLNAARRLLGQTAILRDGFKILGESTFASERIVALRAECTGETAALRSLERWLMVVEHRVKEWFLPASLLFGAGTHAAMSLHAWKAANKDPMRRWLAAWAEFDALVALATYAAEHPEDVYPTILDGGRAQFEAQAMKHPLLPRDKAVANDITLGSDVQFLLISGSNMAGKSTLLRTIGANAVLALAGAPVSARTMKLSALRIGASLAIRDSLAEGKSKFLAEVERLRDVLQMARANPSQSLFLIDEILSGTNSADRRIAAEAVLRGLIDAGAIGALSTHDLTLTELAEISSLRGNNVHMASPDEDDPLAFDYLLKVGINRTTNGLAIVRLLGLSD